MMDKAVTDFPKPGETRRVSLRTSAYKAFDLRYALDLRRGHPDLWALGDALVGEDRFDPLIPVQRRGGSIRNQTEEEAVRQREVWARDHAAGDELAIVVAQIRWLVVGRLGVERMKALVNDAKPVDAAALAEVGEM